MWIWIQFNNDYVLHVFLDVRVWFSRVRWLRVSLEAVRSVEFWKAFPVVHRRNLNSSLGGSCSIAQDEKLQK